MTIKKIPRDINIKDNALSIILESLKMISELDKLVFPENPAEIKWTEEDEGSAGEFGYHSAGVYIVFLKNAMATFSKEDDDPLRIAIKVAMGQVRCRIHVDIWSEELSVSQQYRERAIMVLLQTPMKERLESVGESFLRLNNIQLDAYIISTLLSTFYINNADLENIDRTLKDLALILMTDPMEILVDFEEHLST